MIRVTDVNVTSACNKERRNKIKLDREPSLPEQQQQRGGDYLMEQRGGGDYLTERKKEKKT